MASAANSASQALQRAQQQLAMHWQQLLQPASAPIPEGGGGGGAPPLHVALLQLRAAALGSWRFAEGGAAASPFRHAAARGGCGGVDTHSASSHLSHSGAAGSARAACGGKRWAAVHAAPFAAFAAITLTPGGCCAARAAAAAPSGAGAAAVPSAAPAAGGPQAGSAKPQQSQQQGEAAEVDDLTGTWIKDKERSTTMTPAMNLMHLNGLVRQAVKLVRGVQIAQDATSFSFSVFSVIGWFKVKEVYPLSGDTRRLRRRDLRSGGATGWLERDGRHLRVQLRWADPFGGQGSDSFRLLSPDELAIDSVIQVAGGTAAYTTIYRRKRDRRHGHDHHHHQDQLSHHHDSNKQ